MLSLVDVRSNLYMESSDDVIIECDTRVTEDRATLRFVETGASLRVMYETATGH